jgi:hypothetical protein
MFDEEWTVFILKRNMLINKKINNPFGYLWSVKQEENLLCVGKIRLNIVSCFFSKDVDVNEHKRLSNITLGHKLK